MVFAGINVMCILVPLCAAVINPEKWDSGRPCKYVENHLWGEYEKNAHTPQVPPLHPGNIVQPPGIHKHKSSKTSSNSRSSTFCSRSPSNILHPPACTNTEEVVKIQEVVHNVVVVQATSSTPHACTNTGCNYVSAFCGEVGLGENTTSPSYLSIFTQPCLKWQSQKVLLYVFCLGSSFFNDQRNFEETQH